MAPHTLRRGWVAKALRAPRWTGLGNWNLEIRISYLRGPLSLV